MHKFVSTFVCIIAAAAAVMAQSGWQVRDAGIKSDLVAVFFTSSETGYVAGDAGFLAQTRDGGRTWNPYQLTTTEDINEIYFRNEENGYLVAGRQMFVTRDAGRTWHELRIYRTGDFGGGRPEFLSIRFSDKKRGYVVGSVLKRSGNDDVVVDSLLMRTEDGGDSWQRITVPTKKELFHVDFNDNSHGWVVGDGGIVLSTTDEGRNWSVQTTGTTAPLYNVDFRDDRDGFVVGRGGTILRTEDGGATWQTVSANLKDSLMRVDFADDKNGWIVGYAGTILRSTDRGKTWVRQESGLRTRLYGLFMDKKYGWAVGAGGSILQFRK